MELVITLSGFLLMGLFCTAFEWLWPEDSDQPRWRSDSWIDVFYLGLRITLSVLLMLLTMLVGHSMTAPVENVINRQPMWLQILQILLLTDLISYWTHRGFHVCSPLWRIHAIHHSAQKIDWIVAARNHPFEPLAFKILMNYPLFLMGYSPEVLASVMPFVATYSLLLHANVTWDYGPLRYVIASPAFHRWHHSSEDAAIDKNYAQLFSFYDYLFGSAYFPRGVHSQKYGLLREHLPLNIWSHLIYPVRDLPARMRSWAYRPKAEVVESCETQKSEQRAIEYQA